MGLDILPTSDSTANVIAVKVVYNDGLAQKEHSFETDSKSVGDVIIELMNVGLMFETEEKVCVIIPANRIWEIEVKEKK